MACFVHGCTRTGPMIRGLCSMHYARWQRHGDPGGPELQHVVRYDGALCAVDGCDRVAQSRGWCTPHWKRWRRWGDPLGSRPIVPADVRFQKKVKVGLPPAFKPELGACHLWIAGLSAQGYGAFHPTKDTLELAHRWAWIQQNGPIPEDLVVDHLCRVRACVRVSHLELVTNIENLRRGAGYALQNGMRDSCIHGHEYTPENTYVDPSGGVRCRECARIYDFKRGQERRKAG